MSVSTPTPVGLADSKARRKAMIRRITVTAILTAMAFILMYLEVPLPFMPPFLKFDFSEIPVLVGAFALGPVWGIVIELLKNLIHLPFSHTMGIGELSNFILSLAYALPAVLYYRRHRTKKGAIIGLAIGTVIEVIMGVLTNLYLIFPLYINLYDMSWDAIVSMCSAVNPWIRDVPTMMAFSVVPFNILSRGIVSVITVLVYKKISVPLKKMIQDDKKSEKKQEKELAK